jgi:cell wall-associated NlpC family hydrolase
LNHGLKLVKYRLENAKFDAMSEKIKWIEPQQRYAFCALSVIPVREQPKDSAEQTSQLLFGEPVEILLAEKPWLKVRSFLDGYEGFIDHKQVLALTEKELKRWMETHVFSSKPFLEINGPLGTQFLSGGALIGGHSHFKIGNYEYSYQMTQQKTDIWNYALSFLNTPYLWGGKSIFGIDCSGLVQNVCRQLDINLPRDAYQQAEIGTVVDFQDRQKLDLAFFKNTAGRIHHVGLVGPYDQILHASGQVRLDKLTEVGIYNEAASDFTHSLFEIRRLF